jgi:hypothetical protein
MIRTSYSASWVSSPGTLVTDSAISPTLSVPRKTTDGRISSGITVTAVMSSSSASAYSDARVRAASARYEPS